MGLSKLCGPSVMKKPGGPRTGPDHPRNRPGPDRTGEGGTVRSRRSTGRSNRGFSAKKFTRTVPTRTVQNPWTVEDRTVPGPDRTVKPAEFEFFLFFFSFQNFYLKVKL